MRFGYLHVYVCSECNTKRAAHSQQWSCVDEATNRRPVSSRLSGGVFSALCPNFKVLGATSFVRNSAKFYGGAISLTNPKKVNITGSTFQSNKGASGGAVAITSTEGTAGGVGHCRFDSNDATNGGALYLSTGHTDDTDQTDNVRFVQDSVFLHNVAGESSLENPICWG